MSEFEFDFVVIGGGSGGVRAARIAGALGAKVALVEEKELGGTCVNVGCVPKKLFWYAAHFHEELVDAAGFGWRTEDPVFDWPTLRANKDKEIARLNGIYGRLLETHGVELVRGRGRVTGPNTVEVGERSLTGKHLLIATGGRPFMPAEIPGAQHAVVSDQIFHLEKWPKRVVIVGGGYIAVEFAGIFHGTGCEVYELVRGDDILRGFDDDVRSVLCDEMSHRGIHVMTKTEVAEIEELKPHEYRVSTTTGEEIDCDLILFATGRVPLTRGLFADGVGVEMDKKGAIVVDERFQTSVPSIFAVGDVIDRVNLTPVALAQGMAVARNLFDGRDDDVDLKNIATAVFSDPNIGTVGMTEAEAKDALKKVVIFRSIFTPMKNTMSQRREKTLMKLVVDGETDKVVGCHMVGPHAGEIIQGLSVAMQCGATKAQFDATIGIHPTAAEEFVTMRTPHAEIEI